MNREQMQALAQETLEISRAGRYTLGNRVIPLEEGRKKQERSNELAGQQKQTEERIVELDQAVSQEEEALTAHRLLAGKLDAAISALRDQLKYPDQKTADEQIQRWKDRLDFLNIQVKDHIEAQRTAISQRDKIQGTLNGKQNDLPDLEQSREKVLYCFFKFSIFNMVIPPKSIRISF